MPVTRISSSFQQAEAFFNHQSGNSGKRRDSKRQQGMLSLADRKIRYGSCT
jgi:hypothetical protein